MKGKLFTDQAKNWASDRCFRWKENYLKTLQALDECNQRDDNRYRHVLVSGLGRIFVLSITCTFWVNRSDVSEVHTSHSCRPERHHDIKDPQELCCTMALKEFIGMKFKVNGVGFFFFLLPWKLLLCGNRTLCHHSWFLYLDRACHY